MTLPSEKRRLAKFFQSEYLKLLGFVRRRVDEVAAQDAEDFVHDIALQLFDRADIGLPIEHLSAYVYRALQNRITDYFRKRKRNFFQRIPEQDPGMENLADVVEKAGYDSAPEMRRVEIGHDLFRLLDELDEEEKRLIIANDIHGLTIGYLSKLWSVPVNTLLSRKSRALKKIRRQIQNKQMIKE